MTIEEFYVKTTKELISRGIIVQEYQCSIIRYDYEQNVNNYELLISDIHKSIYPTATINYSNPIKRISKTISQLRALVRQKENVSGILVDELTQIVIPDTPEDKYQELVNKLKQNNFYNPISSNFLLSKILNPEEKVFLEDIFNNPTYNDDWFMKNILNGSYISWTMGCLIEKAFFNVRKNDLYVNAIIDTNNFNSGKSIFLLGLFVENLDPLKSDLIDYINTNNSLNQTELNEDIKNCIISNNEVPRHRVRSLENLIERMNQEELFSEYLQKFTKLNDSIITPYLRGTRGDAEQVKSKLHTFLSRESITVQDVLKLADES